MGQFLDYIASVFTGRVEPVEKEAANHVTFADSSFTFGRSSSDSNKTTKIESLRESNKKTIYIYQSIGALSFILHLSMVTWPKIDLDTFDLLQSEYWQLLTLTLVPLIVYVASIGAMMDFNRPILEGAKFTSKNSGLDFNNNDFIHSLKVVILLMSMCQVSSIISDQLIWSVVMIVPLWCYLLTSRVVQSEYERCAPSPKKPWVKLGMPKSPKPSTPSKQLKSTPAKQESSAQVRATPRTRTRRAVKNIISGVTDKYHAFEQNVAHQLSQKIFTPLSPKLKAIE